jgi:signal transduction histidine kinase
MTFFPTIGFQPLARRLLFLPICLCLVFASSTFATDNQSAREVLKRAAKQMRSSPDSSLALLLQLRQDPANSSDPNMLAKIELELGNAYLVKGKVDSAELYIQRSLDYFATSKEKLRLAEARQAYGSLLEQKGESDNALVQFFKALDYLETSGDSMEWASCLNQIGTTYYFMNDFKKAGNFFISSNKVFLEIDYLPGQASTLTNLGNIALQGQDFETALANYKRSIELKKTLGDLKGLGDSYNNIGAVYYYKKDYRKSRESIEEAMVYRRKIGHKYGIAECLLNLGAMHTMVGDYDLAKRSMLLALALADSISAKELMESTLSSLVDLTRGNNSDSALYYLDSLRVVEQVLAEQRMTSQSAELEAKYQNEQSAREIEYLRAQEVLLTDNSEKAKRIRILLTIGLIVLGLFFMATILLVLKLRGLNARLKVNIKEREKRELQLNEINEELKTLVYRSSHDLKSPLNSIKGLLTIMKDETDPEQLHSYMGMIDKKLDQLREFVTSLLTIGQIDTQEVRYEWIAPAVFVDRTINDLSNIAGAEKVKLDNRVDPQIRIFTDEIIFRSGLQNLVSNAVKYRNLEVEDPHCIITCLEQSDRVLVTVEDNGIGISPEDQGKMFSKFSRFTNQGEGSGIGLYFVKKSIEKIGGNIELWSELGKGSRFTLSFPKSELESRQN